MELQGMVNGVLDPIVTMLESMSWIGTSLTFVDLPMVDNQIMPLATGLGMNLVLMKYTLSLFLVYPLAAILSAIPNKDMKHFFSAFVGIFMMQWIYGPEWIHSFIVSVGTYIICAVGPRRQQQNINNFWVMGYMIGAHAYRMYVSYLSGVFDFTGTQMVLTMKLTSFAFNYFDGSGDYKNTFPEKPHEDKKKARIYGARQKFAITKLPNPLEFFGYVYCFTCLLAGPAFEYTDYCKSIDGSAFKKPSSKGDAKDAKGQAPAKFLPAMRRLAIAVVAMVLHLQANGYFPAGQLYDPVFIASNPPVYKWFYMLIAMAGVRMKFYFVWKVAEGASILGGFGFEGYNEDGTAKGWGGVENIDILGFEMAPNIQSLSRNWNKRTQGWLERYYYNRSGQSLLVTYGVSAVWHGLYPGFFFFFMSIPMMTSIERNMKQKINPLVVPGYDPKPGNPTPYPNTLAAKAYWFMSCFCLMMIMNNIVQPFNFGSAERSHNSLMSFNYVGHILLVVVYVALTVFPKPKDKSKSA